MSSIRINDRIFKIALAASCLINLIGWSLIGLLWRPNIGVMSAPSSRLVRIASLVPLSPVPKPVVTPIKPKPVVRPRLSRNSAQKHHQVAAVSQIDASVPATAKSSGGSHPAARIAARVAPRSAPKATPRDSPVQVAVVPTPETATVVIKSHDTRARSMIVAAAPALSALPGPIAAPSGQAAGTGTGGQGTGQGAGTGAGAGNGGGGGSPGLFGMGDLGGGDLHIVYVLDASLSMSSRIDRARDELTASLNSLSPDETFNIIVFGSGAYTLYRDSLGPATPAAKRSAAQFLDQIELMSGTDLEYALNRALTMPKVNTVVVLTDGVPTEGETDTVKIAAFVRANNPSRARIYTIGLVGKNPDGTDDSFDAKTLLRQIARESGGRSELTTVGDATPD